MSDISHTPDTTTPLAGPGRPLLEELAAWVEQRVHESVGWSHGSRLYGLTILDISGIAAGDADAVRVTFLAEGWVYASLESPSAIAATRYDAVGLCCFGKATRLDTLERFRCRTVLVAVANDQFTVNRLRGQPPELMGHPNGPVSEQVASLFTRT